MSSQQQDKRLQLSTSQGKSEVTIRVLTIVFTAIVLILLVVTLGINNSPGMNTLPSTLNNCSGLSIRLLDPSYLTFSVNMFGGIYIAFTAIAVIYEIIITVLRLSGANIITNNFKRFVTMDIVINALFMSGIIGSIVGCFLLPWTISYYNGAFKDQFDSSNKGAVIGVTVILWMAFGLSTSCFYQYFNMVTTMIGVAYRCGEGCNKCKPTTESAIEDTKPFAAD